MALTRINNQALTNVTSAGLPSGSILQVKSTSKTDTFSTTSATFVDITGLSVDITPTSSSSKMLIMLNCMGSISSATCYLRVTGGNADDFVGDAVGSNRVQALTGIGRTMSGLDLNESAWTLSNQFIDSPATSSQITYKAQARVSDTSSRTFTLNMNAANEGDDAYRGRYVSSITVMEIAG